MKRVRVYRLAFLLGCIAAGNLSSVRLLGQDASNRLVSSEAQPVANEPAPADVSSPYIQLAPLPGHVHSPVVTAIAVDEGSQSMLAAGDDHAIRWVDLRDGRTLATFEGHNDWVRRLRFLPASETDKFEAVSCCDDGWLILWSWTRSTAEAPTMEKLYRVEHTLAALAIDHQKRLIALGGFSHDIYLYDLNGRKLASKLLCECGDQRDFVFSSDDTSLIVGGRDGAVHVYDVATSSMKADYHLHRGRLRSLSLDATGRLLTTVGEDRMLNVIDWQTGEKFVSTKLPSGKLLATEVINDRWVVAAGADNTIQVVDRQTGESVRRLIGHDGSVAAMLYHDNHLITAGFDTTIRIWDLGDIDQATGDNNLIVHPVRSQFFDSGVNEPTY